MSQVVLEPASNAVVGNESGLHPKRGMPAQRVNLVLGSILACSCAVWLIGIRAPFWLDETGSYFQIAAGFSHILDRQGMSSTLYAYIMWITSVLFGSSEIALRIPSVLAMLGAVYVLYLVAREFFDPGVSLLGATVFSAHPIVVFAAIDARPYAFAVLVTNCAALLLLRWMRTHRLSCALGFGVAAAGIVHLHYLFGVILIAFGLLLMLAIANPWREMWSQIAYAAALFVVCLAPLVLQLRHAAQTSSTHVFTPPPVFAELANTIAPGYILMLFGLAALLAAALRKMNEPGNEPAFTGTVCLVLGLVPLALLFLLSATTPIHVFVERYRLVAIPGIALCWALLFNRVNSSAIRVLFCAALVLIVGVSYSQTPSHGYTWKYAVDAVNASTAQDRAPVFVCSDLTESDYEPLPADVSQSGYYSPLTYYKLRYSQAIPLPRALNNAAKIQVQSFLQSHHHDRFLALGFGPSWPTLRWIADQTKDTYTARTVGVFDGVAVIEYIPR